MERMRVRMTVSGGWWSWELGGGHHWGVATERKNKVEVKGRLEVSIGSSQLDMW